ncbi:MAG: hypothetical protein JSR47_15375 [Proteobacteria bacterium]|nr:hypothetical protein [Pseudomonadota bacterium]
MPSNTFAFRATLCLIWALALWHSWICRGLFVDGATFLVQIVRYEEFFQFYPPRRFAMIAGQLPVMTAILLGVTDLHLLARLLSFGLFALPTALYSLALYRARNDTVLLSGVIAIVGLVFLTTSFFIVGEYNTVYALATLVGVRLLTADRLRWVEGLVLVLLAAFSLRVYEAMLYIGPLLVLMTLWRAWSVPRRPLGPLLLYLASAVLFGGACAVAIDSIVHPFSPLIDSHIGDTLGQIVNFWHNIPFDCAFGAALVVVVWALVRPADLTTAKPYRWAIVLLALMALSPLLAVAETLIRPLPKAQYVARTMGGLVVCGILVFLWLHTSRLHNRLKALIVLRRPDAARRLLAFACLMPLAAGPSDILLSREWVGFLDAARATVTSRTGIVAIEDTPLVRWPHSLMVENWVLQSQSLILRAREGDAVIVPPRGFTEWVPFAPDDPPNIGRYYWRD